MLNISTSTAAGVDYYVGWFTLALINAGLAQSKHRSGLNWFLISLLIGPLSTLLLVIWGPLPAGRSSER